MESTFRRWSGVGYLVDRIKNPSYWRNISWLPPKIIPMIEYDDKKPKPKPIFELSFSNTFPNSIFFAAPRNSWVRNCYVKCVIKIPIFWFSFEIFERLIKYVLKPSVALNSTYYDWLGGVSKTGKVIFFVCFATFLSYSFSFCKQSISNSVTGLIIRRSRLKVEKEQISTTTTPTTVTNWRTEGAEINFITIANCLWRRDQTKMILALMMIMEDRARLN